MGIQGPYKVGFAETFPHGAGLLTGVEPAREYDQKTPVEKRRQERDKVSGLPLWTCEGVDFDPEAREKMFRVRIASAVQPVPPEPVPGTPLRPVVFEGLQISGYTKVTGKDRDGKDIVRIAYTVSATGLSPVRKQAEPGKAEPGRAA